MTVKISVVGTGYVGLIVALALADSGYKVKAIDNNLAKIRDLNLGKIPISEPKISAVLNNVLEKENIVFSSDLSEAIKSSDIIFLAVGTPFDDELGKTDTSILYSIFSQIVASSNKNLIIVNKSTTPIGTALELEEKINDANKSKQIKLVTNPEFLSQGSAWDNFIKPERVVIGSNNQEAAQKIAEIYTSFVPSDKVIITNHQAAEIVKFAANSFLACKVAFINEIAQLADKFSANIKDISTIMGLDSRIGSKFLNAGPGYGGSCFPKDIKALNKIAIEQDLQLPILANLNNSNQQTINYLSDKLITIIEKHQIKHLTVWGLSFKANTDDVRSSQAITIVNLLVKLTNLKITCYDPKAMVNAKDDLSDLVAYADNLEDSINYCDAICILTEWPEFRNFPLSKLNQLEHKPILVDFRNVLLEEETKKLGLTLYNFANLNFNNV